MGRPKKREKFAKRYEISAESCPLLLLEKRARRLVILTYICKVGRKQKNASIEVHQTYAVTL